MTRVLIAVPALDMCCTDFAMSLAALCLHGAKDSAGREVKVSLWCQKGSIIMHARNAAVEAALDTDATHLLFLDSDMTFPPDTLTRLLAHGKDIVGGTYLRRTEPYDLLGTFSPGARGSGLLEALSIPFGCVLIKLRALPEKMHRPLFRYLTSEVGSISEDEYFCLNAREAGLTIWCDLALSHRLGHVGVKVYRTSSPSVGPSFADFIKERA